MSDVFGIGGAAQAVGNVASAGIQAAAISHAADKQAEAAQHGQDLLHDQYMQTRSDLSPYRQLGADATDQLEHRILDLTPTDSPWMSVLESNLPQVPQAMTQANLESTPGYQFTLAQGLKATQNSAAARGLGVSGAALKGAATYATGLSDQTYAQRFAQQQALFGNQQTQFGNIQTLYGNDQQLKTNAFNRLSGLATGGQNAAAMTASAGNSAAQGSATLAAQAGNAAGAASVGLGNALSSGVNGVANAYNQNQIMNQLAGRGGSIYQTEAGSQIGTGGYTANPAVGTADLGWG